MKVGIILAVILMIISYTESALRRRPGVIRLFYKILLLKCLGCKKSFFNLFRK